MSKVGPSWPFTPRGRVPPCHRSNGDSKVDSVDKPVPNLRIMTYNYIMQDTQRHLHMGKSVAIPGCPFRFHENQKMERRAQHIQKASSITSKSQE